MLYDIEIAKTTKMVDDKYNIVDRLKKAAVAANDRAMFEVLLDREGNPLDAIKAYNKLGWEQALAIQRLEELAAKEELPYGPGDKYADVVDALAEAYADRQIQREENEGGEQARPRLDGATMKWLFAYVNWLLNSEETAGKGEAALLFKGIAEKKKAIKETLGDEFVTWKHFVPDTHVIWQPQPGNIFYTAFTIPEKIVDAALQQALESIGINTNDVRRAMVRGGRRTEYVIPAEIAATLNDMQTQENMGKFRALLRPFTQRFKKWTLLKPQSLLLYNLRNQMGDLDGTIAGNPKAIAYMPQAAKTCIS